MSHKSTFSSQNKLVRNKLLKALGGKNMFGNFKNILSKWHMNQRNHTRYEKTQSSEELCKYYGSRIHDVTQGILREKSISLEQSFSVKK